ncbi:MAG TPA: sugar ABC transporter substrate-binding protein, partial [Candidatus Dormibacteraeota bacterium]|nr:sugar ABC transporter substrate-binding protein [Candidatus Dormibacteraeota bacterium]
MTDANSRSMDRRAFLGRGLALTGAAVAGPALLAACGNAPSTAAKAGAPSNEKATISFWDTNAGPTRTPIYQELIKRFKKISPNITVNYVGLPIAEQEEKIQAAIAAGAVPDVANTTNAYISSLVAQEGLLALDSRFSAWSDKRDIPASAISSMRLLAPDHKLYALPVAGDANILYYRKDWIDQHHLKAPENWADFYKIATALTDASSSVFGFGMRGGSGSVGLLQSWIFAESGISTYFDAKGRSTFDQPAAVAVIEKVASLYGKQTSKGDISNAYPQMVAEFDAGHAAMIFHNLGSYPQHVQALGQAAVGALPMPALASGKHVVQPGAYVTSQVFKGSKYPDQAFQFAAYLASSAAGGYYAEQSGLVPAYTGAASAKWVKTDEPIQSILATLADKTTVQVATPYYLPDASTIQT